MLSSLLAPIGALLLAPLLTLALGLKFEAPKDWEALPKSSAMRAAEWKLPRAEGDTEDATVVVFNFGGFLGGTAEANIQRWVAQFDPKDGEAKIEKPKDDAAIKITFVDVAGRYVAETRPGSGVKLDKPGWRMIGAVVEGGDGVLFVKALGPKASIAKSEAAIRAYISSAKAE